VAKGRERGAGGKGGGYWTVTWQGYCLAGEGLFLGLFTQIAPPQLRDVHSWGDQHQSLHTASIHSTSNSLAIYPF